MTVVGADAAVKDKGNFVTRIIGWFARSGWALDTLVIVGFIGATWLWVFDSIPKSIFTSNAQVYLDVLSNPSVLLFPLGVTLIAAPRLVAMIADRHLANVRTRANLGRFLVRYNFVVLGRITLFASLFVLNASFIAFWFVPATWPGAIDPSLDGMSVEQIAELDAYVAPLTGLLNSVGLIPFVTANMVWVSFTAFTFAQVAVVATLVVERALLALLVPFVVFLGESVAMQMISMPNWAYSTSAFQPAGLSGFNLWIASGVYLVTLVGAATAFAIVVRNAVQNQRFS